MSLMAQGAVPLDAYQAQGLWQTQIILASAKKNTDQDDK